MTLYRPLLLFGALLILNSALTFHNRWPTLGIQLVPVVSVDLAIILLVLVCRAQFGELTRRTHWVLSGVFALIALGRYLLVTIAALFGRRIDLFWEGQHLPAVIQMLTDHISGWKLLGGIWLLLTLLVVIFLTLHWASGVIASGIRQPRERRLLTYFAIVSLVLFLAGQASAKLSLERWFAAPLVAGVMEQVISMETKNEDPTKWAATVASPVSDLSRLAQADMFIIFFESYGVSVFDKPNYAGFLHKDFADFEKILRQCGWSLATARVTSTTFAGSSWLAHASLLSGIKITNQPDYQEFLKSDHRTLIDRFEQGGYRSIALMPGLKDIWLEGLSYGFDAVYGARRLNYPGPPFGWWAIPDQFSLYRIHQREVTPPNRKPLLVFFSTITSHAPFAPVAPYQKDWEKMSTSAPFGHTKPIEVAKKLTNMAALAPAYLRSIRYNFQILKGYLQTFAPPDALFLVLGDHQPPAAVSGPRATWDVPVHIISRDRRLIRAFHEVGFHPGIIPDETTWGTIEDLNPLLLRTLDSGAVMGM